MKRSVFLTVILLSLVLTGCSIMPHFPSHSSKETSVDQDKIIVCPVDNYIYMTLGKSASEGRTVEDLDAMVAQRGYENAFFSNDGRIVLVLTENYYQTMLSDIHESSEIYINRQLYSNSMPNAIYIEYDRNFTNYEIYTTSTSTTLDEINFASSLKTISENWAEVTNRKKSTINITFINVDTNREINHFEFKEE